VKSFVAVVSVALVAAVPVLAGSMNPTPDITILAKKATTKIRMDPRFKKAVLLEADGTPKSGRVTTAAGITKWRLVFDNQSTKHFKFRSAFMTVNDGRFGKPVGKKAPFVEDQRINPIPKMTLATAVAKLRKAGHRKAFGAVTLRYPLGPGFHETLYIFGFGSGKYWSVGTKTGKVKPIS
jgi:hypothetical protein